MADNSPERDMLFEVQTPLGFRVRVTRSYWQLIVTVKHPVMAGRAFLKSVKARFSYRKVRKER